jgi:YHS domain-containing protein
MNKHSDSQHCDHGHDSHGSSEEHANCAVSDSAVNKKQAEDNGLVRTVADKTYYFCCSGCAHTFDVEPQKYING